ncbi:protein-(glutamine-N5) methyltransferase, release factor-specific [Candidatus Woesearchaeota archaeon B3_Woes]|nr:MAG: protein-(glutamine-N5) methyltransferase, release factor-specific [Candidatus Woesearchaeota archaeon B3_Woes]
MRKIFKNKGIINPGREAEILLNYFLGMSRSEIYLNSERILKDIEKKQLGKKIQKRIDKIPLQYITKHQEFMGMDFLVEKGVLIPRPETEILVDEVIKRLKNYKYSNNLKVVDLGTGTGIIAISIAKFIENIIIYATDISKKSLQVALKNTQKHDSKDKIIFLQGDLFEPFIGRIEKNSLDGIISNPPYIDSYNFKLLPPEIKDNEPKIALSGGIDGLDYYRKIIKKSPYYLKKSGFIALEVGINQSKIVEELIIRENSFNQNIEVINDYLGIERVVIAYRK